MNKELQFKPMTEGLGFHPFADGLPYAPISKAPGESQGPKVSGADAGAASMRARALLQTHPSSTPAQLTGGTGAIAAGPSRYVSRLPVQVAPARKVQVPVATVTPQPTLRPLGSPLVPKRPEPEPMPQTEFGLTYLIKRVLAYGIDMGVNVFVCAAGLALMGSSQGLNLESVSTPSVAILAGAFLLTFNWAIVAAQEVLTGTSLGKRVFGLRLEGTSSALFLRAFFFLPSAAFSGLGLAWALFDRRRRCWHDHVVDLQPEET